MYLIQKKTKGNRWGNYSRRNLSKNRSLTNRVSPTTSMPSCLFKVLIFQHLLLERNGPFVSLVIQGKKSTGARTFAYSKLHRTDCTPEGLWAAWLTSNLSLLIPNNHTLVSAWLIPNFSLLISNYHTLVSAWQIPNFSLLIPNSYKLLPPHS